LRAFDPVQVSGNRSGSYSVNAGIVVPFGSQILDYCKQLASAISADREISSQLSMLRTCAQLEKEGLVVDPKIFPLLKPCATMQASRGSGQTPQAQPMQPQPGASQEVPLMRPRTTRVL